MGKSPNASGEQRIAYIQQQGYDEFEQKVYRRLGNDTETTYTYDPVMRRLSSLVAHRDTPVAPSVFQNNRYSYDLVGNILSVENAISQQPSAISSLGGSSKYTYEYDDLNRLIKAKGSFEGTSNKADYELNMQYNRLNGIVQKALQYTLNGQDKGYTLDYEYNNPKHPHAPSSIAELGKPKARNYTYDGNGNPTYYDEFKGFRSMVWDEENRLRGINDNGRLHLYTYDHTGERALKSSAESSMAVINGLASAVITHTEDYTAYVSPYFVVQKGKFTKHYFEGSSRVVSKLGEGTFSHKNTGIMAGGLDYLKRTQKEQEARDRYIKGLNVPPGPPTQHGIYASPEWTGQPYPSIDWEAISQNQEPPAGWPRYPRFNEPGDVPGPPVQFGPPVTNANVKAGHGFIPNGVEEKNLYYYHPDHLGSSSYITDRNGEVIQHTEYMAFGEVLVDEHSTTNKMPYLFNGKELDFETGLYYYGARYYDPKTSIFLNVDPLVEKTMSPYTYTYNNPIRFIDPTGMKGEDWYESKNGGGIVWFEGNKKREGFNYLGASVKRGNLHYSSNGHIYDFSKSAIIPLEDKKVYGIEEVTITAKAESKLAKGIQNTTFGLVGTIASGAYILESGGTGAILGGTTALTLSLGEIGIGISQIVDSFNPPEKQNDIIHKAGTLPGLVGYQLDSPYAPYIDGLGGFATGMMTGSNARSVKEIFNPKNYNTGIKSFNTISNGIDATLDFKGVIEGIQETNKNINKKNGKF